MSARHEAILVTACYGGPDGRHWIDVAHEEAERVFSVPSAFDAELPVSYVTDPTPSQHECALNNVRSFAVVPDGASTTTEWSDEAHAARERYVEWLRAQNYGINEDDDYEGSPLQWVVVSYGDEAGAPPRVLADSNGVGDWLRRRARGRRWSEHRR